MAFRCKVYNTINLIFGHKTQHSVEITYIRLHKGVIGLIFHIGKIGKITGVGKLIDINYAIIGIFVDKQPHDMASDESGSAGDNDISFHNRLFIHFFNESVQ